MIKQLTRLIKNNNNQERIDQSILVQISVGMYAVLCMCVIIGRFTYLNIKQLSMEQYNPLVQQALADIDFRLKVITPLIGILTLIVILSIPKLLRRSDCSIKRSSVSAFLFFVIGLIALFFLPNPANLGEYHRGTIIILIIFSVLIGAIFGILANPLIPHLLKSPVKKNSALISIRHDLVKSEQDRWGKGLQVFITVAVGLMISGALGWASFPIPEVIKNNDALLNQFMTLRFEQIILAEILALVGCSIIIYNVFQRLNAMHLIFENDYKMISKFGSK